MYLSSQHQCSYSLCSYSIRHSSCVTLSQTHAQQLSMWAACLANHLHCLNETALRLCFVSLFFSFRLIPVLKWISPACCNCLSVIFGLCQVIIVHFRDLPCVKCPKCYKMEPNIFIDVQPVQATEINNNALTGNKWSDVFIHNELGKGFVCLYAPHGCL